MDNFSVRGRSVYHHPIADNDPDMSYPCSRIVGIKNQIPTLKIVKGYFFPRRILRKACRIQTSGRRTSLPQAIGHEAGTVERIGAGSAPYIWLAQLLFCNGNEFVDITLALDRRRHFGRWLCICGIDEPESHFSRFSVHTKSVSLLEPFNGIDRLCSRNNPSPMKYSQALEAAPEVLLRRPPLCLPEEYRA